jgi:PKD repeat protein
MNALANAILGAVAAALLVAVPVGSMAAESQPTTAPSPTSAPMLFGMDASGVTAQTQAGAKPDYGTFWIGPWTLSSGWGGPDAQLASMKAAGVTPAIHFYYWGDDISPSCVEDGCWSSLHNAQKTRAGWETLGTQLTSHLNSKMGGAPVVVFLESEFNKGGIEAYEPFDGYMAAMAAKIHAAYPNAVVVLGFGNWGSTHWKTFDRAAAASDMVGVQGMRGSTKQSQADMYTLYDGLLSGVKTLGSTFPGKPIMLTDIAVSSYPEPSYVTVQAGVLKEVFDNLGTLRSLGVQAMVYRSWKDSPSMDTANYYGQAERHWGVAWAANGTVKASGQVWTAGVKAVREAAEPAPATSTTSASATTTSRSSTTTTTAPPANQAPLAAFTATTNGLGASVDGSASRDPDGQALQFAWSFGDGSTATGATAKHAYAKAGTYTVSLTVSDGKVASKVSQQVTVKAAYTASFTTGSGANANWVEVKVGAGSAPAKVEVKAGDGAWKALRLRSSSTSSTTWGESIAIAKGTPVQFRATAQDGQAATSGSMSWLTTTSSTGTATATATSSATATTTAKASTTTTTVATTTTTATTAFKATFSPKSVGNDWWVETAVSANAPLAKVEAKVGSSGAWTTLSPQDWGTFAKSVNAPNGAYVQFRATSSAGATATSATYVWS